ncbi:unnamed protein product [Cercopithifilaria johnstoni]|uniref:Metalloendopeptidase n=1 Tax=Cercopithifilaria johnstoni TaxID=2874296 RepID=A0A8J2PX76_9BILA|nr:unnamed protein product [Cercopithifilaria johnstoni]
MITITSLNILLTVVFQACFIQITPATLAAIDIQTGSEQLMRLSGEDDEKYHDSEEYGGDDDHSAEAMYREDLFEGDIVLIGNSNTSFHRKSMNGQNVGYENQNNSATSQIEMSAVMLRNAVRQKTLLWPKGRVPYVISSAYANISKLIILEAFKEYELLTCIRFVPKQLFDFDYIFIVPLDGCYSMVGNNGGRQILSLGDGCLNKGIVIHELMHVIGFYHEQNRADRDFYVKIIWENVKPSLAVDFFVYEQFDKYSPTIIDDLGSPYDYDSVTHYSAKAFSRNGKPTIIPKSDTDKVIKIGQRRGLSSIDVKKIKKLYNCIQQEEESKEMELSSTISGQFTTTPEATTLSSIPSTTARNITLTSILSTTHNTTLSSISPTAHSTALSSMIQNFKVPSSFISTYMNDSTSPFSVIKISVIAISDLTIVASTSMPFYD